MDVIQVRRLEIFGGKLSQNVFIIIENFIDEETDDKYISYTVASKHSITQIYKYPDVNIKLYSIIDYINRCGSSFVKNNILYGPNLIDIYDNNYYYITPLLTYESIIDKLDIVKKETNIKLQDLFEEILLQTN